jgi:alkaline phosphatase
LKTSVHFFSFTVKHAGCIDDKYCVYPVGGASFIPGQVFDAYVEVHGPTPTSTPVLEVKPAGSDAYVHVNSLLPFNSAAITFETKAWRFKYLSGDMALWGNPTAAAAAGCVAKALPTLVSPPPAFSSNTNATGSLLAVCESDANGYWWRRIAINAVGVHTWRLSVDGNVRTGTWTVLPSKTRSAKNVILFVGDGMNLPFITATRLVSRGATAGKYNEKMYMQQLDNFGTFTTNGYDSLITDSANSAAAYASGHKGVVNSLGIYSGSEYYATDSKKQDDNNHAVVELITERIRREIPGMAIGIVTTSEIQDATPAAFFSHTRFRGNKGTITDQVINGVRGFPGVKPDVLFGGGGHYFNGTSCQAKSTSGQNTQCIVGTNYWTEYAVKGNYAEVFDRSSMNAQAMKGNKMLGIFHKYNVDTWLDRRVFTQNLKPADYPISYTSGDAANFARNVTDQPDLLEMTKVSLDVLARRGGKDGFFLMVEASSIDKAEHPMDFDRAMAELIDFDNAIGQAIAFTKTPAGADTLVLVTADHAQGYDAFGTVDTMLFNSVNPPNGADFANMEEYYVAEATKVASIGVYSMAGYPTYTDANGDNFPDSWAPRITLAQAKVDNPTIRDDFQVSSTYRNPDILQGASGTSLTSDKLGLRELGLLASGTSGHTFADVPLYGSGPGSEMIKPIMDNVDVHTIMAVALGLGSSVQKFPASSAAPHHVGDVTCDSVIPTFVQHATLGLLTTSCPVGSTFCNPSTPYVIGSKTYYQVTVSAASLNLAPADGSCKA